MSRLIKAEAKCCLLQSVRMSSPITTGLSSLRQLEHVSGASRTTKRFITCPAFQKLRLEKPAENDRQESIQPQASSKTSSDSREQTAKESLQVLEWPALCRQVAAFASTPMAAHQILISGLPLGRTKEESQRLLQQTEEAVHATLEFQRIYDLHPATAAAKEGAILRVRQLHAVAVTLESAFHLGAQLGIHHASGAPRSQSQNGASKISGVLRRVMEPIAAGKPKVLDKIQFCVGEGGSFILDRADERLASARAARKENYETLTKQAEEIARRLFASKASETSQVTQKRGRLCVSVKAGRQGELPRGSVKMGSSRTGATVYMEPATLMDLNNRVIQLQNQEEEAERVVLQQLSQSLADEADSVNQIMDALIELDMINCRAKHAAWLSAVKPSFHDRGKDLGSISLSGARHPLLMARSLPPLPSLTQQDDSDFEGDFKDSIRPVNLETSKEDLKFNESGEGNDESSPETLPQPIDLLVPAGKTSVVLTGPNTGGKTATLKTLGLLTLMPKAGLFVPADPSKPCSLEWFSEVLADVGDSQDLAQNLSTFSGHVHKLKRITNAVTPSSLVLLDELGSGTDPVEGGCLAAVLLEWLLTRARLTFCTSHHADLKELSASDNRFVNANVEFNVKTLMPTYRLMWGSAGESQALAVAEGLGFDADVVRAASEIASQASIASKPETKAGELKDSLAEEVEGVREEMRSVSERREEAESKLAALEAELKALDSQKAQLKERVDQEKAESSATERKVHGLLAAFKSDKLSLESARQQLESLMSQAQHKRASTKQKFGQAQADSSSTRNSAFQPKAGESVRLLSMKGAQAMVQSVSPESGKAIVLMGNLPVEARITDLAPWNGQKAGNPQKPRKGTAARAARSPSFKTRERLGGGRSLSETASTGIQTRHVTRLQVAENTADLRGMYVSEALDKLEKAMRTCPPDSVLFVVHGLGTGKLRAAVQERLGGHSLVKQFEYESSSDRGCTVVELNR